MLEELYPHLPTFRGLQQKQKNQEEIGIGDSLE
jgi:hypothetical protein